ncbi:AbrB/MazE/SpoVT family DNA-binding domain-containing protein [Rhodoferax sp.]|uniref:AbrB/MazE/SpoVT family DNA-binding domain-containing protein n=1 Tax=Rhodoferax sp. TaxID=50421 RepID=UPI0026108342|nr:AbrB/MazE/SpoVT family DNA-binding domain-containing protein [Rhodoferax sp.]MDD5479694.1 antitoxin [Rhodoferax sp.]
MPTATLRTVGGSVVMAIPKRLLELVHLQTGAQVNIDVQDGKLIVAPLKKARYTLAQLLAQCDGTCPMTEEDRNWLDAPPVGLEIIEKSH